ncbi:hypothetical protein [Paenacidovorax monticola]|nr:hypothetical protein [Paenacidovorax monticola]
MIAELAASRAAGDNAAQPRDGEWYNVPAPLAIGRADTATAQAK